jgi:hypothetical protein
MLVLLLVETQTYKVNQSHNRNFVYVPTYNTTTGEFDATSLYRENSKKSLIQEEQVFITMLVT